MELLFKTAMSVALAAILAAFGFVASKRSTNTQWKEVQALLTSAELSLPPSAWLELLGHFSRRSRWGAWGGGMGFGVGFLGSLAVESPLGDGGGGGLLGVTGMFVGALFGMAASALVVDHRSSAPRVTSLQPHGLLEYLGRRTIAAEGVVAAGGMGAGVVGLSAWNGVMTVGAAGGLAVLGLATSAVAINGLLATGHPWWYIGGYFAALAALGKLALGDHRITPHSVPVAHALAGRQAG